MDKNRFWIILIVVHLLFFSKQMFIGNSLIQDSKEYLFAANNIIEHQTLYAWNLNHAFNADWLTKRPILYPLILAILKILSFGSSYIFYFLIYALQNIISLASIYLCLKITEHFKIKVNWWKATLFMVLCVSQFIYANMIMSEIWLQFTLISILYFSLTRSLNTKTTGILVFLIIAAMSLKPVMIFATLAMPFVFIFICMKSGNWVRLFIVFIPLLFFLSVSAINKERTGYFHYSSISTINLLHYNTYSVLMHEYGQKTADSIIDNIHTRAQIMSSYSEEQMEIQKSCKTQLFEHIGTYTFLHFRGILFCLMDPGRFDFTQFFNLTHKQNLLYESNKEGGIFRILKSFQNPLGILLMGLLLFNLYKIFLWIKFITSKHFKWGTKLLLLAIPIYILGLTGPIGTSRFFMPLIPFIFLIFLLVSKQTEIAGKSN
ncbi:MAG: hypothetical protein R2852_01270 [Bacteroidia bacterium]